MRNYNTVLDVLEITTNPGNYFTVERFNGGQKMSSIIYIPSTKIDLQDKEQLRNLKCVEASNYNVIGFDKPELSYHFNAQRLCFIANRLSGLADTFNLCDNTKLYWVYVGVDKLNILLNSNPINIETLYVKFTEYAKKREFTAEFYTLASIVRKFNVKHVIIETPASNLLNRCLMDIQKPFSASLSFVIILDPRKESSYYLGVKSFFKENGKTTSRFVIPNSQLLETCNQYFYQDNAFVRFSPIQCTDDDISYNVIYWYRHRRSNDVARFIDIMNIMDYRNHLRSR